MTSARLQRAAAAALLILAGSAVAAGAQEAQPFSLVRAVQRLQTQIAEGSGAARDAQPKLVKDLAEAFAHVDPALWKNGRNAEAVAMLLLSGAPPAFARKLVFDKAFDEAALPIVQAALEFADGHSDEARLKIDALDLASLNATIAGQFALVGGTLHARGDRARANLLFDQARLLMPGTLVEETALRRQVFLAEEAADVKRFRLLASQYLRRFSHSVYAPALRERLPDALIRLALSDQQHPFEGLGNLLADLDPDERRAAYLKVARIALSTGRLPIADTAASRALELSSPSSINGRRAALYQAAAALFSPDFDKAAQRLRGIDLGQLEPEDVGLAQAALSVAGHLRIWPPPADGASGSAPALTPVMQSAADALERARLALSQKNP